MSSGIVIIFNVIKNEGSNTFPVDFGGHRGKQKRKHNTSIPYNGAQIIYGVPDHKQNAKGKK